MSTIKILVVADPYERDRIRAAAAAAGGVAVGAEAHDDLAQVVSAARPDAIVLAGGVQGQDPAATARRLRVLAGAGTAIVFVGEAAEVVAVERVVDAAFLRPVEPGELVSRAIALTLAAIGTPAAPEAPVQDGSELRRVAASIDEAINAEMLSALRTVTETRPIVAAPAAIAQSAAVGGTAILPPPDALDDLWDLLGPDVGEAAGWVGQGGPALAGELADVDAPLLLGRIFNAGTTGRLVVEAGGVERTIYFEAGRPVYAASSSADDRLIAMLVRDGRLTPAQHQTALLAAKESGRRMGALLVDLGVLEGGELLPAIRQHYEELVFSLFSLSSAGRWRIEPGVMASPTQIRLLRHPAALVRHGLRRAYPLDRIWERLGSRRNVFSVELGGRGADILGEMVASGAERRVPMLFDGVRPLAEVVRLSGLPEGDAVQLIFALSAFSLLRPASAATPDRDRFAVHDRDIERERILARHALALDCDYFDVLGVSRRASPQEIHRAYELVCRDLSPARLGPELTRSLARELETLREVVEEALRVLGTAPLRTRYEAHLPREAADRVVTEARS